MPKLNLINHMKRVRDYNSSTSRRLFIKCTTLLKQEVSAIITKYTNIIIVMEITGEINHPFNDIECISITNSWQLQNVDTILYEIMVNNSELIHDSYEIKDDIYFGFLIDLRNTGNYIDDMIGTELLVKRLPDIFFLSGLSNISENKNFFLYSNVRRRKSILNQTKDKIALMILYSGYGDFTTIFQQIQFFVNKQLDKGLNVEIITYSHQPIYKLAKMLLKQCKLICVDTLIEERAYESILRSGIYKNCYYLIIPYSIKEYHHMTDIWEKALGIQENFNWFHPKDSFFEDPPLSAQIRLVDLKKSFRYVVGFQFYTDSDFKKCWPIQHVIELSKICFENDICLVNLSPHPYKDLQIVDMSLLKVTELFSFISELNALIGIDSFAGHIAGVIGVPNITIWGRNYPHHNRPLEIQSSLISCRPLTMNYSIVSQDTDASKVMPYLVFKRLMGILNGNINLKKSRITIEDSLNDLNIEWI